MREESSTEFFDSDSQAGAGKERLLNFRWVLMSALDRATRLQAVEFRGGYWQQNQTTLANGNIINNETYVPDSRDEYVNSVVALYNLLLPYALCFKNKKSNTNHAEMIQQSYGVVEVLIKKGHELIPLKNNLNRSMDAQEYSERSETVTKETHEHQVSLILAAHSLLRRLVSFLMAKNNFEPASEADL